MSISPNAQLPWCNRHATLDRLLEAGFQAYDQEDASPETAAASIRRACSVPIAQLIMRNYDKKETESSQRCKKQGFHRRACTPTPLKESQLIPHLPADSTPKPSSSLNRSMQKGNMVAVRRLLPVTCDDDLPEIEAEAEDQGFPSVVKSVLDVIDKENRSL